MKQKQVVVVVIKILLSIGAVLYVFQKVPVSKLLKVIETSEVAWLVVAFCFFVASKLFSVARLHHIFKEVGIALEWMLNAKLYWLGMFYNQFLPGGVGGDVYKTLWISRHHVRGKIEVAKLIFWDRISGLLALFALLLVLSGALYSIWWILGALVVSTICYGLYFLWTKRMKRSVSTRMLIEAYSFLVQLAQLIAALCLMQALHIQSQYLPYLVLFLLSSVASALPFTLGGIGAREFTFMFGSTYLGLSIELATGIGFLFYLISLVASLGGIVYLFIPLEPRGAKGRPLTDPIP